MTDLPMAQESRCPCTDDNAPHRVAFRQAILRAQDEMQRLIDAGVLIDRKADAVLKHYYSPVDEEYKCCAWARLIVLPGLTYTIGKIHRHQHLNFILKGAVRVWTEYGQDRFAAPLVFLSRPYTKRAVYAEEETLWSTVHLTKYPGEENLAQAEDEIFAKTYGELGICAQPPLKEFPAMQWLKEFDDARIEDAR